MEEALAQSCVQVQPLISHFSKKLPAIVRDGEDQSSAKCLAPSLLRAQEKLWPFWALNTLTTAFLSDARTTATRNTHTHERALVLKKAPGRGRVVNLILRARLASTCRRCHGTWRSDTFVVLLDATEEKRGEHQRCENPKLDLVHAVSQPSR